MRRTLRHFTPATVLAGLALFIALGGTGWAGQVIGHGSVRTAQLGSNAVTAQKIGKGAVTRSKIAPGAVGTAALGKGVVGSDAIAPGGITADKFAAGVLGGVVGTKITTVNSAGVNVPAGNDGTVVSAICATGQKAVGGGWNSGLNSYVISEGPNADGTGWTASFGTGSNSSQVVTVSAVCIAP